MPKIAKPLSPIEIKRLSGEGYHSVGHVAGLLLQVGSNGSKSWMLRIRIGSKRREIGLGSYPAVGLGDATSLAQAVRDKVKDGIDPLSERLAAKQSILEQQHAEKSLEWTFKKCAEAYIKAKSPEWKSIKHGNQWETTLETYAYPVIENMPVAHVGVSQVMEILEAQWLTKHETMRRLRNRIELVLDWAGARGYRKGDNPARWRGNLDSLLAIGKKAVKVKPQRSLDASKMYEFMQRLRAIQGMGARSLEFVILTACRSGEARLATWTEIDLDAGIWCIPAERMKAEREHRVALSKQAISLLKALPRFDGEDLVFPSRKPNKPLSDMTLNKVMRDMAADAVPHGFRSTFSSWCASSTAYPEDVREMALAHSVGSDTVKAYQRSDLFDKRRMLMQDWAKFIETKPATKGGKVVQLFGSTK